MSRLHAPPTLRWLPVLLIFAMSATSLHAQDGEGGRDDVSLYERLGGYDVIAAVVDEFFARFGEDPELTPFLGGINAAEGARVRQRFVDFACARTGGPCLYLGRDMRAAHEGLPIADVHFDRVMGHLQAAVSAVGVPEDAGAELIAMFEALRSDIVPR